MLESKNILLRTNGYYKRKYFEACLVNLAFVPNITHSPNSSPSVFHYDVTVPELVRTGLNPPPNTQTRTSFDDLEHLFSVLFYGGKIPDPITSGIREHCLIASHQGPAANLV